MLTYFGQFFDHELTRGTNQSHLRPSTATSDRPAEPQTALVRGRRRDRAQRRRGGGLEGRPKWRRVAFSPVRFTLAGLNFTLSWYAPSRSVIKGAVPQSLLI